MLPELLAEFFGTLVLILFGNSVIAMVVLFGSGVPGEVVHGGRTNITIDFPRRKVLPYSASQTAGAFFAAAIIFAEYRPAFLKVDPTLDHTASVFTTFPAFPGTPFAAIRRYLPAKQ